MSNQVGMTLSTASEQASAAIAAMPERPAVVKCPVCDWQGLTYEALTEHYREKHPNEVPPVPVTFTVNGKKCTIIVEPNLTLKKALQFHLGLFSAKEMCDRGACGSCTVIIDGRPVLACTILASECGGKNIETIEGIATLPAWKPLIDAYCKWDAMQCGYCTPGFIVTAKALLDRNPNPTLDEIKEALSGNICTCGTYPRHAQAIQEAVEKMSEGSEG